MNAIFTYLTWTAELRQAKKKKVGITRHLDMIPGTLLPEHLPSFAWLNGASHVNTVTEQARLASE